MVHMAVLSTKFLAACILCVSIVTTFGPAMGINSVLFWDLYP